MKNDKLISALRGTPRPVSVTRETAEPVAPEGGYRTSPPVLTNPAAEHSATLGNLLATRRLEADTRQ
jgi:hypothetical protein